MKIYVDIIFLINLIYDFLILNAVNVVLRRYVKVKRIFICSFMGSLTSFSLFIPFLNNIFITIFLSIIMVIVTFGVKDFVYVKNNLLYFYMVSVIFGGFLYLINVKINHFYNPEDIYKIKILINFLGIIFISPVIYFLYLYSYKTNQVKHQNYYNMSFSFNNYIYHVKAFYDTGNLIKDPYKGRAVILVKDDVLHGDIKNKSPIYVPCQMINNSFLIKCYKPDLVVINNHIINNTLIGLIRDKIFYDGVDAIISGYIGDKIR